MSIRRDWSEEDTILAFDYYQSSPPNQYGDNSDGVKHLAKLLDRTPGAVAKKLYNLMAFDDNSKSKGLSHGSHWDKSIFEKYAAKPEKLQEESDRIYSERFGQLPIETELPETEESRIDAIRYQGIGEDDLKELKTVRRKQYVFRKALLTAYKWRCCISGISSPDLLIASHIKPYALDKEHRVDPQNGLLLNALLDRAFDRGLFTVDATNLHLIVASNIKDERTMDYLKSFKSDQIEFPFSDLRKPNPEMLEYHNDMIFEKKNRIFSVTDCIFSF